MPYLNLEVRQDSSSKLFQEIVRTIPVEPYSMKLVLGTSGWKEEIYVECPLSANFRRGCLPLVLSTGVEIVDGIVTIYPFMKSYVYLTNNSYRTSATLRIAGDTLLRVDPAGKIMEWWKKLEKNYKPFKGKSG